MNMRFLKSIGNFIKTSYPTILRRVLWGILGVAIITTFVVTQYQKTTTDERIAAKETEIKTEYPHQVEAKQRNYEEAKRRYELCQESSRTRNSPISEYINLCQTLDYRLAISPLPPLEKILSTNEQLRDLNSLKANLDSGVYWLTVFWLFILFFLSIPPVRLAFVITRWIGKQIWRVTGSTRHEAMQMSSFQKYSLILSALILIALVVVIILIL